MSFFQGIRDPFYPNIIRKINPRQEWTTILTFFLCI